MDTAALDQNVRNARSLREFFVFASVMFAFAATNLTLIVLCDIVLKMMEAGQPQPDS